LFLGAVFPVVGFQYDLTKALALNFNLKYNNVFSEKSESADIITSSTFRSFGANIGLVYTFGSGSSNDSDE
jgi:hypothetical protein